MELIKQFFRKAEFVTQEAMASMARSAWMSWLVILTIAVSLSTLGGFWMLVQDLRSVTHQVGRQVPISAFVAEGTDPNSAADAIRQMPGVKAVVIIPKEKAWEQMQTNMRTKMTFDNLLDGNPLPNTLKVETNSPEETALIGPKIKAMQGIEDAEWGAELIAKIGQFQTFIRTAGLALSGILALASLAIIMNTIRLAVMGRRREIEIMHLVGASNSFIAWPFLLEGMLFGFFGTLLTAGVLFAWRYFTLAKWQELFPFVAMGLDIPSTIQVLGCLALIGMGLGAFGSLISVRKHIKLAMAD